MLAREPRRNQKAYKGLKTVSWQQVAYAQQRAYSIHAVKSILSAVPKSSK